MLVVRPPCLSPIAYLTQLQDAGTLFCLAAKPSVGLAQSLFGHQHRVASTIFSVICGFISSVGTALCLHLISKRIEAWRPYQVWPLIQADLVSTKWLVIITDRDSYRETSGQTPRSRA